MERPPWRSASLECGDSSPLSSVAERFSHLNPEPRTLNPRSAFTLIELSAVLAIMGILIAVAVVSLKDVCRAARIQHATEQLLAFDRHVRERAALHTQPATMTIDLDKNTLASTAGNATGRPVTTTLFLGNAVILDRIQLGRCKIDFGRATIGVTDCGSTPTYAARLRGADGSTHWFLFAGLTGQTTELRDDTEIDKFFEALSSKRFNAH